MKYRIITLIGLAGSTLAVCFGGWDKFLQTLLLFMAIDWFTGGILLPAVFGKGCAEKACHCCMFSLLPVWMHCWEQNI